MTPSPPPPSASRVRDAARRNTRARFEQWAKNPTCQANTLSAVHNVKLSSAAKIAGAQATFGQSPFALAHGETFERGLFWDDAKRLREALIEKDVLAADAPGFLDLRIRMNGGRRLTTLDEAIAETASFLRSLPTATRPPAIVAGAAVRIPKGVMLPEANLIIDALAIRENGGRREVIVGEIKTYPDRGGYTGSRELAGARAQAGIYLHALELVLDREGLMGALDLASHGFLVLTRPGSNRPSVRAGEDLRFQAARAKRGFELLERAATAIPSINGEITEEALIEAVLQAPTTYSENCLSFCDLASRCFDRAVASGDPTILGEDVRRFVGEATLPRVLELLDGAQPTTDAERDLVTRIAEAEGRMPA